MKCCHCHSARTRESTRDKNTLICKSCGLTTFRPLYAEAATVQQKLARGDFRAKDATHDPR